MAAITAAIRKAHGWTADLVPADIAKSIDQAELLDRVIYAEELGRKSRSATDPTLRKGYSTLARAVLRAQPRAVTARQSAVLVAKAAGVGNTRQADALRAAAQRLLELHPPAPRREDSTAVAKAKADAEGGELMLCYDAAGNVFAVCDPSAIRPVASAEAAQVGKARARVAAPVPSRRPGRR